MNPTYLVVQFLIIARVHFCNMGKFRTHCMFLFFTPSSILVMKVNMISLGNILCFAETA